MVCINAKEGRKMFTEMECIGYVEQSQFSFAYSMIRCSYVLGSESLYDKYRDYQFPVLSNELENINLTGMVAVVFYFRARSTKLPYSSFLTLLAKRTIPYQAISPKRETG